MNASTAGGQTADNKQLVLTFLDAAHRGDRDAIADLYAEDVARHGPRPSSPLGGTVRGKDALLQQTHVDLYRPGSLRMDVEHIVAEGDFVAIQFILRAVTARGEPYENFYHHLFECREGKIAQYWLYVDTQYAQRMLFE